MRTNTIVLGVAASLLVLSGAGLGYAAGSLPKNSVGSVQIKKNAVTGVKVKDGSLGTKDLSAAARTQLQGKPTTASFATEVETASISGAGVVVTTLSGAGNAGQLTVSYPSRLLLNGAVTVGNNGGGGEFSVIVCSVQISSGGAFSDVGDAMKTESLGNSNHDQTADVALAAGKDVPAGTYDVRIRCLDDHKTASSSPIARGVGLTVMAAAR